MNNNVNVDTFYIIYAITLIATVIKLSIYMKKEQNFKWQLPASVVSNHVI